MTQLDPSSPQHIPNDIPSGLQSDPGNAWLQEVVTQRSCTQVWVGPQPPPKPFVPPHVPEVLVFGGRHSVWCRLPFGLWAVPVQTPLLHA